MRAIATLALVLATSVGGCYRASRGGSTDAGPTVIEVDNQSFYDFNIYVLPEASNQVRLGLATGKKVTRFVIPAYLTRSMRQMRFIARPLATQTGDVSEEIVVVPGDTIGLLIPPG